MKPAKNYDIQLCLSEGVDINNCHPYESCFQGGGFIIPNKQTKASNKYIKHYSCSMYNNV